jgi:hypothetical protein
MGVAQSRPIRPTHQVVGDDHVGKDDSDSGPVDRVLGPVSAHQCATSLDNGRVPGGSGTDDDNVSFPQIGYVFATLAESARASRTRTRPSRQSRSRAEHSVGLLLLASMDRDRQ